MSVNLVERPLPLGLAVVLAADLDDFPFLEDQRFFSIEQSGDES